MTIKVNKEELELILQALNVAGGAIPECDDLHDAIVYGDRVQGE